MNARRPGRPLLSRDEPPPPCGRCRGARVWRKGDPIVNEGGVRPVCNACAAKWKRENRKRRLARAKERST